MIVNYAGSISAARPSISFAPPVPPVRTAIIRKSRKPMEGWSGVRKNFRGARWHGPVRLHRRGARQREASRAQQIFREYILDKSAAALSVRSPRARFFLAGVSTPATALRD